MTAITRIAVTDGYNILSEIKDVYNSFFNKSYLSGIIEELPGDKSKMNNLYHLLNTPFYGKDDKNLLLDVVLYLDYFLKIINQYLLPELKDQLGISGFTRNLKNDSHEFVIRSLIYHSFPHNLKKLDSLTLELKKVNLLLTA